MNQIFHVTLGDTVVGRVQAKKQGLYLHLECRVTPAEPGKYRLVALCQDQRIDLGLCVPREGGFELSTRIPIKRFPTGNTYFLLTSSKQVLTDAHIPIRSDESFPYLHRLEKSHLELIGDTLYAVLYD